MKVRINNGTHKNVKADLIGANKKRKTAYDFLRTKSVHDALKFIWEDHMIYKTDTSSYNDLYSWVMTGIDYRPIEMTYEVMAEYFVSKCCPECR